MFHSNCNDGDDSIYYSGGGYIYKYSISSNSFTALGVASVSSEMKLVDGVLYFLSGSMPKKISKYTLATNTQELNFSSAYSGYLDVWVTFNYNNKIYVADRNLGILVSYTLYDETVWQRIR